ncbi:MAG TPA: hypothetical protein VGO11_19260 [Chthoniobacteraceae bacterium]|jgi:hypothetical protein|nr:hypothetical protein [Chthoniobacteraceae bacterium]
MRTPLALLLLLFSASLPAAEPAAVVHRVFGRASAPVDTALPPGAAFTTGAQSKSELTLPKGLARVGEHAAVETSAGGLALRQGVTLVASAPGQFRKTIEVRAPGYRLKVKGTVQVAFEPGRSLKVVVLEGNVTVALDSLAGEYESLRPGQMLVINPSDRRLPEPVEVDVQRLAATSTLVGKGFSELATAGNIKAVTGQQVIGLQRGDLQTTDLLLRGLDNSVEIQRRSLVEARTAARLAIPDDQAFFEIPDTLSDPAFIARERTFQFAPRVSAVPSVSNKIFARNRDNAGRTHVLNVRLLPDYVVEDPNATIPKQQPVANPTLSGHISVSRTFFASDPMVLQFNTDTNEPGFDRLKISPDALVHTPAGVGLSFKVGYGLEMSGAHLLAGNATRRTELLSISPEAGDVLIDQSTLTGGSIALRGGPAAGTIQIDNSKVAARGPVSVGSETYHTGITIRNSSELRSLASNLKLAALRAGIQVDTAALLLARRNLTIDAFIKAADDQGNAIATPGVVRLGDAHLVAQAIRVRGFADGTDALVINGTRFNATQLIKLYAEGASTLRFQGDVKLTSKLSVLAGKTIQVDSGGTVTLGGRGLIFTDNEHFNTGAWGTIEPRLKLTHDTFDHREKFNR